MESLKSIFDGLQQALPHLKDNLIYNEYCEEEQVDNNTSWLRKAKFLSKQIKSGKTQAHELTYQFITMCGRQMLNSLPKDCRKPVFERLHNDACTIFRSIWLRNIIHQSKMSSTLEFKTLAILFDIMMRLRTGTTNVRILTNFIGIDDSRLMSDVLIHCDMFGGDSQVPDVVPFLIEFFKKYSEENLTPERYLIYLTLCKLAILQKEITDETKSQLASCFVMPQNLHSWALENNVNWISTEADQCELLNSAKLSDLMEVLNKIREGAENSTEKENLNVGNIKRKRTNDKIFNVITGNGKKRKTVKAPTRKEYSFVGNVTEMSTETVAIPAKNTVDSLKSNNGADKISSSGKKRNVVNGINSNEVCSLEPESNCEPKSVAVTPTGGKKCKKSGNIEDITTISKSNSVTKKRSHSVYSEDSETIFGGNMTDRNSTNNRGIKNIPLICLTPTANLSSPMAKKSNKKPKTPKVAGSIFSPSNYEKGSTPRKQRSVERKLISESLTSEENQIVPTLVLDVDDNSSNENIQINMSDSELNLALEEFEVELMAEDLSTSEGKHNNDHVNSFDVNSAIEKVLEASNANLEKSKEVSKKCKNDISNNFDNANLSPASGELNDLFLTEEHEDPINNPIDEDIQVVEIDSSDLNNVAKKNVTPRITRTSKINATNSPKSISSPKLTENSPKIVMPGPKIAQDSPKRVTPSPKIHNGPSDEISTSNTVPPTEDLILNEENKIRRSKRTSVASKVITEEQEVPMNPNVLDIADSNVGNSSKMVTLSPKIHNCRSDEISTSNTVPPSEDLILNEENKTRRSKRTSVASKVITEEQEVPINPNVLDIADSNVGNSPKIHNNGPSDEISKPNTVSASEDLNEKNKICISKRTSVASKVETSVKDVSHCPVTEKNFSSPKRQFETNSSKDLEISPSTISAPGFLQAIPETTSIQMTPSRDKNKLDEQEYTVGTPRRSSRRKSCSSEPATALTPQRKSRRVSVMSSVKEESEVVNPDVRSTRSSARQNLNL